MGPLLQGEWGVGGAARGYVRIALNVLAVTRETSLTAIQYFHIGLKVICRFIGKFSVDTHAGLFHTHILNANECVY